VTARKLKPPGQGGEQPVASAADQADWDGDPLPIDRRGEPPPFPVDVMPKRIAAMVRATATSLQVPADLPGMLALAVLSTAAGGRVVIEVADGWREPANIYTAPVMPSGSRKSPTYAVMTEPIRRAEAQLRTTARAARAEALAMAEVRSMQADKARRSAATADDEGRDDALAEAIAATEAALSAQVPPEPELVADDVTSESLVTILAEQGGRVALLAPEGDVMMTIAGRYNGKPNPGVLLRGWCGEGIRVRRGSRQEDIPHVYITLCICLQPEMLREIADVPGFRGRGVLARHLFAVPADTVGFRKAGAPAIKAQTADAYVADMQTLVLSLHEWTDPYVLTLTEAARKVFREWEEAVEPRLRRAGGDLGEELREWGSKLVGTTARLAGLLHLGARATGKWGDPIDDQTMKDAITLAEYLIQHARIAFGDMVPSPAADNAIAVLDWITAAVRASGKYQVTRREVHSGCRTRTRFRLSADLTPPLALLREHGYIQPVKATGSRSEIYAVHPSLLRPDGDQ
jgi:replicative DNA helicase